MSLVDTLMQPLRTKYTAGDLDKNEFRRSRYGVLDTFQRDTNSTMGILSPDVRDTIKRSFGNTVSVPVFDNDDVTITNVRSCTVADDENTTKLVTLTFVTYVFGFTMYPSQHYNNQIKYQQDFDKKLEKCLLKFAATLDTACYNKLNTDKNQYFPAAITSFYAQVANALQIAQASKNDAYNQISAIMEVMDFYGQYNVVASTQHKPLINYLVNQGNANNVNTAFQFGGFDYSYSNRVTNGAGVQSTAFIMPQGTVAIENRNDPDSIAGSKSSDGVEWGQVQVPLVNMKMGYKYNSRCVDANALHAGTSGLTSTLKESFEWSTDVCLVSAYNSNAAGRYNPIVKAEITNA